MSSTQEEGWHSESEQSIEISPQKSKLNSLKLEPNNLISESYPIEPDMLLGWRPKLPSGPVPLNYVNYRTEYIMTKLADLSFYRLVYLGNRHIDSVKVNQQYDYSWKQRNKYRLNLRLLKEVIQFVGNNNQNIRQKQKVYPCQYVFDSNFQSGNLDFVIETKNDSFDCFVKSDTNTKGHCNWFYFAVTNKEKTGPIKLTMCNLTKNANLYRRGMKPYFTKDGKTWKQLESNISYIQKYCRYGYSTKNYQLEFEVEFENPNQTIYVAYGIPYTYSTLEAFTKQISREYSNYVTVDSLCQSLGGLPLPLLTITDQTNYDRKQVILITGRIHPGQSVSSFVVEGFVRSLLTQHQDLLQRYIFKIIPMMNPDGVVVGNFRTGYAGKDLNRQFNKLNKHVFPEIYYLDKLAKSLKKEHENKLVYYFDFHGHSTKTNLFCYGPEHNQSNSYYLKCRALPKIIQQQDNIFSYRRSIFTINPGKKNTGRASMLRKLKIPMTFTFELSNGLYEDNGTIRPLQDLQMHRAGVAIIKGFSKYTSCVAELRSKNHMRVKTKVNLPKPVLTNFNQRQAYSSEKLNKKRPSITKKIIIHPLNTHKRHEQLQLDSIYDSIIKEQIQMKGVDEEGGSDSEDEGEDLDEVETDLLFKTICRRQIKQQKTSSGNSLKLKSIKHIKHSVKSQKSDKQTSIKEEQQKEVSSKPSTKSIRSLTARIRRPTIPLPVPQIPPVQPPVQKQVLIQKHFVLNL